MNIRRMSWVLGGAYVLLLGCGGGGAAVKKPAPTPKPTPTEELPTRDPEPDDGLQVEGLLGSIDMYQVNRAIERVGTQINDCQSKNIGKLWYIGGTLTMKFRIARDGAVKSVAPVESDVGSYAIEKCVLDLVSALDYGKPRGGEAEFSLPIQFEARTSTGSWDEDRVTTALRAVKTFAADMAECRKATPPGVKLPAHSMTLYVAPGGKVTSAGFSGDGIVPEPYALCVVEKAKLWKLSDTGGEIVKAAWVVNK